MDTSEEYIKMCDCPKIQDRVIGKKGKNTHDFYHRKIPLGGSIQEFLNNSIWLPRQDQIQEILPKNKCKCLCCLVIHLYEFLERNIERLADVNVDSMEQLWLAFYMFENHQKIWNGKKWIKSETE